MYSTESNADRLARLVEHGEHDARRELRHEHHEREHAEVVPDVEILRRVVARQLTVDELTDGQSIRDPLHHAGHDPSTGRFTTFHGSHRKSPLAGMPPPVDVVVLLVGICRDTAPT